MTIGLIPNDVAQDTLVLMLRSTGNFARTESIPLMSADEFKAAMEKAKGTTTTYNAPTATR
jgi:Lipocalin-like domain